MGDLLDRQADGTLTARRICELYLERIEAVDRAGPQLGAVLEINPQALAEAEARDRERAGGRLRGPLHGIPLLIKDNIETAAPLTTTAGSLALAGSVPDRPAPIVERLTAAGAIILGKANLSEWANFRSTRSTSGWSSLGGQTRNPYALDRNPSGSSSGSGAAVAANLAPAALGTETDGSIVSPAAACGIVGLKPTVGLVSRTGIIPIAESQDTAGPMTRTVRDAALLLQVLAAPDPADPATRQARIEGDYTAFLQAEGLQGARIGVGRQFCGRHPLIDALFEEALETISRLGGTIVDPVEIPTLNDCREAEITLLLYEFKDGLNRYLAGLGAAAPVQSLDALIEFNEQHAAQVMPFFGQEILMKAAACGPLTDPAYLKARDKCRALSREKGLDAVFQKHGLDALIAPTRGPAWLIDPVNGDSHTEGASSAAAVSGYPHLTQPLGSVHGLPVNLSWMGLPWQEGRLIQYAFAFEQEQPARRPPAFLPSAAIDGLP